MYTNITIFNELIVEAEKQRYDGETIYNPYDDL